MSTIQWPPRRAGCQGGCNQGRSTCDCGLNTREGLQRVDSLRDRADTDPALPIGQDEPETASRLRMVADWAARRAGWITLWVMVGSVSAALLLAHWGAR